MELIKDMTNRDMGLRMHTCRICGAEGGFQSYLAREMMQNTREEFEYFVCPECGCLQIAEIPQDLGRYYGSNYYSFELREEPDRQYANPVTRMEKILDVGCGSGYWLVSLADAGFGNLYGCDPFLEKDLHYGERVHIRSCPIHEMDGDDTFDLVRMNDSFEHVTDPLEVFISAKRLLKKEGVLEISIPTYPNIAFEMFGPHWYQLDAPRHITLHSVKSLGYLTEKAGLKIREIKYDSNNSQIIRSFFYQHGVPFYDITEELTDKYFTAEDFSEINQASEVCNKNGYGDHMTVYICKKEDM